MRYSEIIADVTGGMSQRLRRREELDSPERGMNEFKTVSFQTFDKYLDSDIYTLK